MNWLDIILDQPGIKTPLHGLGYLWDAAGGQVTSALSNEAYKVLRSFGLVPFSIGMIIMSAINKSLAEMDDFQKPAYNGVRTAWDPFNSMNYIEGTEDDWDPLTTIGLIGTASDWDPVLWSNGGEGFPAAWNPVEVIV